MQKLQNCRALSLLISMLLLWGCAGQPTEEQPVATVTAAATAEIAAEVSTSTATVVATNTPPPTQTPTAVPSPTTTPTNTPDPTSTPRPVNNSYRVSFVAEDDVLNLRAEPNANAEILTALPPHANDILLVSGQPGDEWVEVRWQDTTGWVNRYYLTADVNPQEFCDNPLTRQVVDQFRAAVESRDAGALAELIHPRRGLLVRLNWWNNEIRIDSQAAKNLFTAEQSYDWGYQDGSGEPIEGAFNDVVMPVLERDLAGSPQIHCNNLVAGPTAGITELPFEYRAINTYTIHRPAQDNELDWGTWVLGIEYWSGKPYLTFLVHYQWEI